MTPYEIHEPLLQHIDSTGCPAPNAILIPHAHPTIPAGIYRLNVDGLWIASDDRSGWSASALETLQPFDRN
jgi:hypothetical protein